MQSMSGWRGKRDLDLTAEDLVAMADAGVDVDVSAPPRLLPGGAIVVGPTGTRVGETRLSPLPWLAPKVGTLTYV